jgi:hypothetical protein
MIYFSTKKKTFLRVEIFFYKIFETLYAVIRLVKLSKQYDCKNDEVS